MRNTLFYLILTLISTGCASRFRAGDPVMVDECRVGDRADSCTRRCVPSPTAGSSLGLSAAGPG